MKQYKKLKASDIYFLINQGTVLEVIVGKTYSLLTLFDIQEIETSGIEDCTESKFYEAYDKATRQISEFAAVPLPNIFLNENLRVIHKK